MGTEEETVWEPAHQFDWRLLIKLKTPISLKMRRRKNGRWIYREPTHDEETEFVHNNAW